MAELVGDMVRPAGNITGLTLDRRDQQEKSLQILKEVAPHIIRVGVLRNPLNPAWRHYPEVLNDAAHSLGLELVGADARGPEEFDPAFAAMAAEGVDALFVVNDPVFVSRAASASTHRRAGYQSWVAFELARSALGRRRRACVAQL